MGKPKQVTIDNLIRSVADELQAKAQQLKSFQELCDNASEYSPRLMVPQNEWQEDDRQLDLNEDEELELRALASRVLQRQRVEMLQSVKELLAEPELENYLR